MSKINICHTILQSQYIKNLNHLQKESIMLNIRIKYAICQINIPVRFELVMAVFLPVERDLIYSWFIAQELKRSKDKEI